LWFRGTVIQFGVPVIRARKAGEKAAGETKMKETANAKIDTGEKLAETQFHASRGGSKAERCDRRGATKRNEWE